MNNPSAPDVVRVAGIVLKWIRANKEANFNRIEPMIREAAAAGAEIVCTTECFLDGYAVADRSMDRATYFKLGERIPGGEYFGRLSDLTRELGIFLAAGIHEDAGDNHHNAAVLIDPNGELVGKYHKHRCGEAADKHTPGTESPTFATSFGRIGMMICKDRTDGELVKRFSENGCDFMLCLSGGAFGPVRNDPKLQSRSRENGLYIVFVHPAEFLVTGPDGGICAQSLLGDPLRRADALLIPEEEIGTDTDQNQVFYFDLPLGSR